MYKCSLVIVVYEHHCSEVKDVASRKRNIRNSLVSDTAKKTKGPMKMLREHTFRDSDPTNFVCKYLIGYSYSNCNVSLILLQSFF